jgi:hypothetical protein
MMALPVCDIPSPELVAKIGSYFGRDETLFIQIG